MRNLFVTIVIFAVALCRMVMADEAFPPHKIVGNVYYVGMLAKYEQLQGATKTPFIDQDGYRAYVELKEMAFRKTLAEQQAEKALGSPKSQP